MRQLHIPAGLSFSDLDLEIAPGGGLRFLPQPLRILAHANNLDADAILADEERSCELLVEWYVAHREAGGEPDAAAETIVAMLNARGS